MSHAVTSIAKRVPELDGFRGLAIFLVMIGHFGQFSVGAPGPWTQCAEVGVLLFFILSGFLITTLLCSEERSTLAPVNLRQFYARRALRLLPAVWTLILVVVVLKLSRLVTDESWGGVGASLCYVRNVFGRGTSLGHLWSLSLEEQFYFVWPLLFVALPRHRLVTAVTVITAVALARAVGIGFSLFDIRTGVFYLRPWFRFDSIMSGCVLALVKQGNSHFFARPPAWLIWATHPVLAFFVVAAFGYFESSRAALPWCLTLQTLACTAMLAGIVARCSPSLVRMLSFAPITFLGKISYSLYLWQQLFLVTKVPSWGLLRRPPVDLLAASACALFSWYLVERPFLELKSRLETKSKRASLAPSS